MNDPIHPQHYKSNSGLEAINVMEAFFGDDIHLAIAFKYMARAGRKYGEDEVQDLEKALYYIKRRIQLVARKRTGSTPNWQDTGKPTNKMNLDDVDREEIEYSKEEDREELIQSITAQNYRER